MEVNIMPFTKQEFQHASQTIDACSEELMDLMATFRMYSGKTLDIDRGDFDIAFFKEIHSKCSDIHEKIELLGRLLHPNMEKMGKMTEGYMASSTIRLRTIT
jgi:hypothetical protein